MQSSPDGEFAPFTSFSFLPPTNYVQKLIFVERSRFYKDMQKLLLRKIKKPPNPQGTEKLGDTTLINAYAFTHPTVNAGATPVISRNSEVGSSKGDVKALQPRAFSLKHTFAYYSSSTSLHYKNDCRQISRFCQCENL